MSSEKKSHLLVYQKQSAHQKLKKKKVANFKFAQLFMVEKFKSQAHLRIAVIFSKRF